MKEAIEAIRFYWWAKEYGNVWKYLESDFLKAKFLVWDSSEREKGMMVPGLNKHTRIKAKQS